MLKARGMMFLDGDFKAEHPQHESFSRKQGETWTVTKCGPTYMNQYEVTEFDDAGLAWLVAHDRSTPTGASNV